ncbi:MAG TPA: ABC transporter permease subunit [Oscillospiraceae bacterium]|nr:ABC transporter permease subunit [Oscillospiraceae bacterium]HPF56183.1 ABC transporter permease subunit [Clostridiales bacterium]HPK36478.1 ABC transporter permease subunit [Oscillospiraceae bacterium]HPR75776.1 ABC transporter permease subunit [Oscillospiraceae bacterium]
MSVATRTEVEEVRSPLQKVEPRPWGLSPQDLIVYLMILPAILMYVIFTYVPMPGMITSFCEYTSAAGFKAWTGLENLVSLMRMSDFPLALRNNVMYAALGYVINFPAPIILALLFNEMRAQGYKKAVQTMTTIPHFINWIVISGIFKILLDPDYGWVNSLIKTLGGTEIYFLGDPRWFPFMYVLLSLWKSVGWGTILYLATMASIDHTLYEAAAIDGAGRWRQTWHVTLPALKGIILLILIMSFKSILDLFDAMFILYNVSNREVSLVLDTLVYYTAFGSGGGNFGLSSAMSLFKTAFGAIMTIIVNETAKKLSDDGRGIF